jgi:hypothetical protein
VPRKILGLEKEEVRGSWGKVRCTELPDFYSSSKGGRVIKTRIR